MELNSGRFITLAYTLAELTEILEVKKHLYTFPHVSSVESDFGFL